MYTCIHTQSLLLVYITNFYKYYIILQVFFKYLRVVQKDEQLKILDAYFVISRNIDSLILV